MAESPSRRAIGTLTTAARQQHQREGENAEFAVVCCPSRFPLARTESGLNMRPAPRQRALASTGGFSIQGGATSGRAHATIGWRLGIAIVMLAVPDAPRARRSATTGRAATMRAFRCAPAIPAAMRHALRARHALPRLGVFLSGRPKAPIAICWLKSRVTPRVETALLRVGRARRRRHRAAERRRSNLPSTASAATTGTSRFRPDPDRQELPSRLRSAKKAAAPGPIVRPGYAARRPRLLSQEPHHPPAAKAVLHFGRGAVADRGS